MTILAVIAARQGSKRLPGKNIKNLGGRPLINWTIEAARDIEEICDLLVSTDSEEIARIASAAGAFVPWIRPSELATDSTDSVEVVIHALNWYENVFNKVEGVLLLQPTSPFRTKSTITRGILEYRRNPDSSVIGVSPCGNEKSIVFIQRGKYMESLHRTDSKSKRIKTKEVPYCPNGTFYLTSPATLRRQRTFFEGKLVPLHPSSEFECLDIDTLEDWLKAEAILE